MEAKDTVISWMELAELGRGIGCPQTTSSQIAKMLEDIALTQAEISFKAGQDSELEKKLDDREADLLEAKREERERLLVEVENKMFSQPIQWNREFILRLSTNEKKSFEKWQALKGEK